jgi:hypothetical protein
LTQERVSESDAVHVVEGGCLYRDDPGALMTSEQRLNANDESAASRFSNRVNRRKSRDEDDQPSLPARSFQHPGWNRRLTDAMVR